MSDERTVVVPVPLRHNTLARDVGQLYREYEAAIKLLERARLDCDQFKALHGTAAADVARLTKERDALKERADIPPVVAAVLFWAGVLGGCLLRAW
jgi:hypothetical protein